MDKGLITIRVLEKKIKSLEIEKSQNNNKINDCTSEELILESEIVDRKTRIAKLNDNKFKSESALNQRKSAKKSLIISTILACIVVAVIASLTAGVAIGGVSSILKMLGTVLLMGTAVSVLSLPIEFKAINKKYPIKNLADIEEYLLENGYQLELLEKQKKYITEKLTNLKKIETDLETQIEAIIEEINSIAQLRSEVIEEFCNNNAELDEKLNDAYDKSKVKEKVK